MERRLKMAKIESSFKNMALALTLIAMGASACLAFVYELTKEPIARTVLNKKTEAIRQVVPEFNNDPNAEMFRMPTMDGDSLEIYPAKVDDNTVGYAVNTYTDKGFGGKISLMAGFKPDGTIFNIAVLEHKETPGLGTKMSEPSFKDQFMEKNPSDFLLIVKNDGGPVDAITAATISSRAFCDAVQRAYGTLFSGGTYYGTSGPSDTESQ